VNQHSGLLIGNILLKTYLVILILFLTVAISVEAQIKYSKLNHLTIADGLSSNRIRCIYRDSRDFLWMGTDVGLDRYDSYDVKTYRHNDSIQGAISSDILTCIYEDTNKNMWFGTVDGLDLYIPSSDKFKVFRNRFVEKNSINSNFITGFVEDKSGNLWIVTDGNCLNKWDSAAGNFIRFPFARKIHGLSVRPSRMAAVDSKGYIWIGSLEPGITRFDPVTGTFQTFEDPSSEFNSYNFKCLYIDKEDKIWIATDGNGFSSYDPAMDKFEHFKVTGDGKGTNLNFILDIIPEDDRYLLLAVDQGGINRFDKVTRTFEYIMNSESNNEGLNNNGVWCFHKDKQGILWIGTSGGGINFYNPEKERFQLYTHDSGNSNSLSYDFTGCFYEDHEGMIWIGTDGGGVDVFNPKTGLFHTFRNDPADQHSISGNVIRGIAEDRDHNMWIGTWDAGLNKFDRKTQKFIRYTHHDNDNSSISNKTIWNLFIDHENTLWISIYNVGIDIFDYRKGVVVERFRPVAEDSTALSGNNCWFFYEDQDNNMWICTQNGLDQYDRRTKSFRVLHFPDNDIAAVYRDQSRRLWVGTNTEGMFMCDTHGKIIKEYNSKNLLPGNRIHAITQDNEGNIWISGNQGICRLNPESNNLRNYTKEDGLQGDQFYQQAFLKTRKGEMYFGGYKGFNSFYPDSLKDNKYVPPVYLTDFQIFNKPVNYSAAGQFPVHISEAKEIRLKWDQSVFSLSFAAISYVHQRKNQYAYKLEGFEKDWNYTDARRRYVTYTNLDPGEYTFKVKASNNDGIWNESGVSLKIIVSPPWWKTIWFTISSITAGILGISLFVILRLQKLKNQKSLLEKLVEEKTSELKEINATKDKFFSIIAHDLKNPFNTIIGFSEMLKDAVLSKDTMTVYKYATMINFSSVQTFRLLENLLDWASSQRGKISFTPVRINVRMLVTGEIGVVGDMAVCKNIQLENNVPDSITIFADKNMLTTILRNLITNAIKFTHKNGRIEITAQSTRGYLEISVSDNGIGMTSDVIKKLFRIDSNLATRGTDDEKGTGLGLVLCKEFVTRHGGRIWAESEAGKGSTFRFLLPYDLKSSVRDKMLSN
jgi:signal transduction histidine kinase/ligand-binding sensor domain-containing protein